MTHALERGGQAGDSALSGVVPAGRIAVVTGASSGIGRSVVEQLASGCAGIVLHARSSRDRLEGLARDLSANGVASEIVLGDLAEPGVGQAVVEAARQRFGRLDVLVANAGFPMQLGLQDATLKDIEYALRGNLVSFFELASAAHDLLRQSDAPRVIAVGSFTSFLFRTDLKQFPVSAASKGGLVTATRSVAAAMAKDGITVNCVVPGYIEREQRPGPSAPGEFRRGYLGARSPGPHGQAA